MPATGFLPLALRLLASPRAPLVRRQLGLDAFGRFLVASWPPRLVRATGGVALARLRTAALPAPASLLRIGRLTAAGAALLPGLRVLRRLALLSGVGVVRRLLLMILWMPLLMAP